MFDDDMIDGKNPRRGWNRAVIQSRSRRAYKPNITIEDLLMPSGLGTLRMLRSCVLMAGIMTVLYVWIPLWFLITFVPISDLTYALVLGFAFLSITAVLYLAGARETRRDRELGTRL